MGPGPSRHLRMLRCRMHSVGRHIVSQLRFVRLAIHLQALLDKSDVTLEELLDDDGIIQECKSLNARLIHL